MLVKIAILIELIAVMICVHHVFGKKFAFTLKNVIAIVLMFITLDIVNVYDYNEMYSYIAYIVLFIYCVNEFREGIISTFISVSLSLVISTIIQFICAIGLLFINTEYVIIRGLCASIAMLLITIILLPFCRMNQLKTAICRRHWLLYLIFGFIISVIVAMLFLNKTQSGFDIGLFIFGIPAVIIMLFIVAYWDKSIIAERKMKREINTMQMMQENYEDLVMQVRFNQHGLNNHMTAILSSHYSYENYEQLVAAQKDYCKEISSNNQVNELILLENKILSGFLYQKTKEIQEQDIKVNYKIKTNVTTCAIPNYYLIEILGCILDNAKEAVITHQNVRVISIQVEKVEEGYKFSVGNPFPYTSYDDIKEWFSLGNTTKGNNRGIGLYQVKKICNEYNSSIVCRNDERDYQNWIIFELIVKEDGV